MSLEILNLSLEKISKLKKKYACEAFFDTKNTLCTLILLPKKPSHAYFFLSLEIFSKLRFKISKLIFFGKKTKFKKYTHSEVEFGEFSTLEFGDFPELRFKRNKIPKNMFFFKNQNEFGEFSKFKC